MSAPVPGHPNPSLHTNIKLLRGVRSRTDVRLMSKDRRDILVTALHAADFVVTEFVHGSQGAHAEWGNRYFRKPGLGY